MTENQVLKLRPEFSIGNGMSMIEWFEIHRGVSYYIIHSGLRHADGVTKSPYFYEKSFCGRSAKKEALEHFTQWYNNIKL